MRTKKVGYGIGEATLVIEDGGGVEVPNDAGNLNPVSRRLSDTPRADTHLSEMKEAVAKLK